MSASGRSAAAPSAGGAATSATSKREFEGRLEGAKDGQRGGAAEVVGGRQGPAPPGDAAPQGHPCGSRSDGPSMRTVWHWWRKRLKSASTSALLPRKWCHSS